MGAVFCLVERLGQSATTQRGSRIPTTLTKSELLSNVSLFVSVSEICRACAGPTWAKLTRTCMFLFKTKKLERHLVAPCTFTHPTSAMIFAPIDMGCSTVWPALLVVVLRKKLRVQARTHCKVKWQKKLSQSRWGGTVSLSWVLARFTSAMQSLPSGLCSCCDVQ